MAIFKKLLPVISILFLYSFISPYFEWYKFENSDCSLLFPGAPKHDTLHQEVAGEQITLYIHSLKAGKLLNDSNYGYELVQNAESSKVLINAKKDVMESYFEGVISSTVEDLKGKVLSEKDITLNDYYGKDVTISFSNDMNVVRIKCYLVNGKGFTLEVYSPTEKQQNDNAAKFFDSFKIK